MDNSEPKKTRIVERSIRENVQRRFVVQDKWGAGERIVSAGTFEDIEFARRARDLMDKKYGVPKNRNYSRMSDEERLASLEEKLKARD